MKQLLLFSCLLTFSACSTMALQNRKIQYIKSHAELTGEQRIAIYKGGVIQGMTEEMVRVSWGEPTGKIEKTMRNKKATAWLYQRRSGDCIEVYEIDFVNGEVIEARQVDASYLLYPPFKNCRVF